MSKFEDALTTMFYGRLLKPLLEKEQSGNKLTPEEELVKKASAEKLGLNKDDSNNTKKSYKVTKFDDIKDDLLKAFKDRNIDVGEPASLVHGFLKPEFATELNDNPLFRGSYIPIVTIVGDNSGRLYFFALKLLLPNLEI